MPENKVTINARQLADALRAVIPHASTEATLPMINAVKFESVKGRLAIIATDRYTLGCFRLPEVVADNFEVLISLADARALEKAARTSHRIFDVTLRIKDAHLSAECFRWHLKAEKVDAVFPAWEAVIVNNMDCLQAEMQLSTAVNAVHLARFMKAVEKPHSMVLYHNKEGQPSIVSAPNFIGVIMPLKPGYGTPIESWVPGYVAGDQAELVVTAPQLAAVAS